MGKLAHAHHEPLHPGDVFLPIITLGFYGLRRFRPRWLYSLTAFAILAAWVGAAFLAASVYEGGEYLVVLPLMIIAAVTFFRLFLPPSSRKVTRHH
jgi:hypothetical protein